MNAEMDQIARARALAPMLMEAENEIERRRELPPAIVTALIEGGFFRMLQPRFLGGAELRPVQFCQVTEALSTANASVAWCVGQNNGCSMSAAYLDPEVAREIFGPPTGILAWGPPGAPFEAQPVDAAIGSAGGGGLRPDATMQAGSARTCRSPVAARYARCCSRSPAFR